MGETERMTLSPVRKCDKKREGLRFHHPFKGTYQELPPGHTFKNFQSAWPESAMLRQRQRRGLYREARVLPARVGREEGSEEE